MFSSIVPDKKIINYCTHQGGYRANLPNSKITETQKPIYVSGCDTGIDRIAYHCR